MKHSTKTIVFSINAEEHIKIDLLSELHNSFRYDEVTISYVNNNTNREYIIYTRDVIIYALGCLEGTLNFALMNKLKLHNSIKDDIGYLWALEGGYMRDRRHRKPNLVYKKSADCLDFWIGNQYILWSTPCNQIPNVTSWLYEKDGKFFFEITPNYPPDYRWDKMKLKDAKKDPNFKTFKEFMQTYQPLVVTTIERSVLEQWLHEVERLIPLIEANDSKYFIKQEHSEQ